MGISCDLEAESMDSETKPTCNKEFVKLNGRSVCNNVTTAKTAFTISTPSDDVSETQKKSTNTVINLVSPTPPETETIVIVDDAEPEEGEIINTDSDFEYEAISSDEEFTLRQQIEALEAKNRELEKIASISSRTIDYDFTDGYHRSQPYPNYKTPIVGNRANITKLNPLNYKALSLSHVENISSDEAQLVDSENEFPNIFDKSYSRSHRKQKEKRQNRSRKTRAVETEKERCLAHGKRRCTDIDCISIEISRKKRVRHKYDDRKIIRSKYSSDSEDELLRNREELKMALNIIEPPNRTANSSSLLKKLSAIQNQSPLDDSKKSSTNKHRKRKNSRSPEQGLTRRRRTNRTNDENNTKHSKSDTDRLSKQKSNSPIVIDENNDIENDIQDDEDEAISLEEQELRLIALKSAVLKKHEARKKKQMATNQVEQQVIRPYSPTDSVVLVPDEVGDRSNDCIDSDNNNMDISPISSPRSNQYQPMDMDLASSNENSRSPVFSYEKPQTISSFEQFIDWGTVHIPVPINAGYVEIDHTSATMNQSAFALQSSFPLVYEAIKKDVPSDRDLAFTLSPTIPSNLKENELNEDELRAQLIEQMRSTNNTSLSNSADLSQIKLTEMSVEKVVPKPDNPINVDSLEEDCLRSLLLSSKGKKSTNIAKDIESPVPMPTIKSTTKSPSLSQPINDIAHCDDIPKLTLNLREALKRLKNNQQNKKASNQKLVAETKLHVDEGKLKQCESLENCDFNEIRKTVVNNRVDNNENELCHNEPHQIDSTIAPSPKGSDEMMIDDSTSNDSYKKEPTIQRKIDVNDEQKPLQLDSKSSIAQKIDANVLKRANVESVNSTIASKVAVKSTPNKQSSKVVVKQSNAESNTTNKLKVIPSAVEPEPVVIQPRPESSTPPIGPKINLASIVNSTANISKLESIRKSTASPVVAWTPKPVKKLIISINADSSSDTDDLEQSSSKKSSSETTSTEPVSNSFQLRLDQFLQKVRANTTHTNTDMKQQVSQTTKTTSTDATAKKTVSKTTTLQKSTTNSAQKAQISSKIESSKAVQHLPMSSQLEYHRLLNRMKMLEKQKEEKKSRLSKQEQTVANFPNLTVVVKNENRIIQTGMKLDEENGKDSTESTQSPKISNVNKLPTNKAPLSASNTSLAKRVLVKNALDSLSVPKTTSESKSIAKVATMKVVTSLGDKSTPVQANEQTVITNTSAVDSKPTSMSLAAFAKKTPKVRASVLANYVKRFRSHGEQYLNDLAKLHRLTTRTNVETKKQQKLEQVLAELKRQTQIVEGQLAQQKTLTQSLYPAMAAIEKAITSERILLHKLENCCNRLGNIVKGSDYKIQCDKAAEIKEKMRQINIEKNKLRILKQEATVVPAAAATKNIATRLPQPAKKESAPSPLKKTESIPKPTPVNRIEDKKVEAVVKTTEKQIDTPIKVSNSTYGVDKQLSKYEEVITTSDPPTIQASQKNIEMVTDQCENDEKPQDEEMGKEPSGTSAITDSTGTVAQSPMTDENMPTNLEESQSNGATDFKKANELNLADKTDQKSQSPDNLTDSTAPLINVIESETLCGKYDSPLVHLQNCVDSKSSISAADRNAIVCPYDLMGRCEDKQCEYKHLSM